MATIGMKSSIEHLAYLLIFIYEVFAYMVDMAKFLIRGIGDFLYTTLRMKYLFDGLGSFLKIYTPNFYDFLVDLKEFCVKHSGLFDRIFKLYLCAIFIFYSITHSLVYVGFEWDSYGVLTVASCFMKLYNFLTYPIKGIKIYIHRVIRKFYNIIFWLPKHFYRRIVKEYNRDKRSECMGSNSGGGNNGFTNLIYSAKPNPYPIHVDAAENSLNCTRKAANLSYHMAKAPFLIKRTGQDAGQAMDFGDSPRKVGSNGQDKFGADFEHIKDLPCYSDKIMHDINNNAEYKNDK